MIKLRKFSLSDLERVMEIEKASFPNPWPESYFKKLYTQRPNDFIVAKLSKKATGYILGYIKSDNSGSIKTLGVDPNYRNQGIGTKLMNFTIKRLKKKGVREVFLHSRIKNKIAHLFFKKLGFEIIKELKNYYPNGDDAYLMKKEI